MCALLKLAHTIYSAGALAERQCVGEQLGR